jgi:hypothetical protein
VLWRTIQNIIKGKNWKKVEKEASREKDNRKGRKAPSVNNGESSPQAKLTVEKVKEMRRLYDDGIKRIFELAFMFGLSRQCTSRIVKRKGWKSVPG